MASTHWTVRLFGENLIKCATLDESVATLDCLNKTVKYVGIYFSFANINAQHGDTTTHLQHLYERLNSGEGPSRRHLEIVQVVLWANNDVFGDFEASHNACISQMPWLAVPYTEIDLKTKLSRRFRLKVGVPMLVLLDADGATITLAGKERLAEDPFGEYFPWRPRPLHEVLRDVELISVGGNNILYKDLPKDSIKAFYFSANWCPPCRAFTPQLIETYKQVRKKDANFNVIFVSSDRSMDSFTAYLAQMPWLAVPFDSGRVRSELAQIYGVRGIPTVLLVDDTGVVSPDARSDIQDDPSAQNYPWRPRLVNTLNERFSAKLREHPAVILFIDEELDAATAEELLKPIAGKYRADSQQTDELNAVLFLVGPDSDTSDLIKDLVGLEDLVPLLAIVDLPNNRSCTMDATLEITSQTIGDFVDEYRSNRIEFKEIQ